MMFLRACDAGEFEMGERLDPVARGLASFSRSACCLRKAAAERTTSYYDIADQRMRLSAAL